MNQFFHFGEQVEGYNVRVLNEREVRASAGILFVFAFISFFSACTLGNIFLLQLFVVIFFIEFCIRVFINPMLAPFMILGRFFVRNQKPEYSGAPQKRFAWGIGFLLSFLMGIMIFVFQYVGPVTVLFCFLCLFLLFFESAFGICLGCNLYNLLTKRKAELCPGGVCEIQKKEPIQEILIYHILSVAIFSIFFIFLGKYLATLDVNISFPVNKNTGEQNSVVYPASGNTPTCALGIECPLGK